MPSIGLRVRAAVNLPPTLLRPSACTRAGCIPTEICHLTALTRLLLHENKLSGALLLRRCDLHAVRRSVCVFAQLLIYLPVLCAHSLRWAVPLTCGVVIIASLCFWSRRTHPDRDLPSHCARWAWFGPKQVDWCVAALGLRPTRCCRSVCVFALLYYFCLPVAVHEQPALLSAWRCCCHFHVLHTYFTTSTLLTSSLH